MTLEEVEALAAACTGGLSDVVLNASLAVT